MFQSLKFAKQQLKLLVYSFYIMNELSFIVKTLATKTPILIYVLYSLY